MALQKMISSRYGQDFTDAYHMVAEFKVNRISGMAEVTVVAYYSAAVRAAHKAALQSVKEKQAEIVSHNQTPPDPQDDPVGRAAWEAQNAVLTSELRALASAANNNLPMDFTTVIEGFPLSQVADPQGDVQISKVYTMLKTRPRFTGSTDVLEN